MTPKEAIDTLTNLAAHRHSYNGEADATATWMLGVRQCIQDLAANATAQRDTARLDHILPKIRMTRADIDFDMGMRE